MIKTDDRNRPKAAIQKTSTGAYAAQAEMDTYQNTWLFETETDAILYFIFLELHEIASSLYTLRQKK